MSIMDLVRSSEADLAATPDGSLCLKRRAELWAALAGLVDPRTGYVRRVRLNTACVRQVLGRWNERFPQDHGVENMLRLAKQVVAGDVDPDDAIAERDRFYVDVVETRKYGDDPSAMFVGLAAANTVIEALVEDNGDAIPGAEDDEELDPEAYDTSYMCASAAARGLNGRPADVEARRAFWLWYLDVAIPEIYSLS
jgi:hypothetical protein